MYTPTFEDLAGDESTFFSRYFNQAPLLRRQALPVDPRAVLGIADLDELLSHDAVRLPYLRIAKGGSSVREATYSRTRVVQNETVTDAVDPERVRELFRSGATITWNSINHMRPNLRDMTAMLCDKFSTRSDAIAFLTPAGRQGYAPHHDPVDVFVMQLEGTKEWQLWKTPENRMDDTGHYDLEELGEPEQRIVLGPGDVLYLPYSTPHVAVARTEMSLHLSIVVQPRLWRDLMVRAVTDLLTNDREFADFPYLGAPGDAADRFGALASRLADRLGAIDATREVVRLRDLGCTEDRDSENNSTFADIAAIDRIDAGSKLALAPDCVLSFGASTSGRTSLVLTSHASGARVRTASTAATSATVDVPDAVAERLRSLARTDIVLAGEFYPGVSADRSVSAARSLARLGIVAIVS